MLADISTAVNKWIATASMKPKIIHAVFDYVPINTTFKKSKEIHP